MKILIDLHHAQLAISLQLLLVKRLGYTVYMLEDPEKAGVQGFPYDDFRINYPTYPINSISYADLPDLDLDMYLVSSAQNTHAFKKMRDAFHPKAKLVGQGGNEDFYHLNCEYMITSAYQVERHWISQHRRNHVLHYYPEIDEEVFKYNGPPNKDDYQTIRCYMPILDNMNLNHCKYCSRPVPHEPATVDLAETWHTVKNILTPRGYKMYAHGHGLIDPWINYYDISDHIAKSGLTWHFKASEGWGFSALCSIFCGRPILTNMWWIHTTTIRDFLFKNKTAFSCDFKTPAIILEIFNYYKSYDFVCEVCEITNKIARTLFDYKYEAQKVKHFLEGIV